MNKQYILNRLDALKDYINKELPESKKPDDRYENWQELEAFSNNFDIDKIPCNAKFKKKQIPREYWVVLNEVGDPREVCLTEDHADVFCAYNTNNREILSVIKVLEQVNNEE